MRLVFIVTVVSVLAAGICLAQRSHIDGLSQGIKTDKPVYELGQTVRFQYAIRNDSSSPATLKFPSAKQFDIWVTQGGGELYRASRGTVYAQSPTSMTLKPGEVKTFSAQWNQADVTTGKQIGPGVYTISAQLATAGKPPAPITTCRLQIGMISARAALVPVTVCEAVANAPANLGRKVMIRGTYRGVAPEPDAANTKSGPPVTSNDWVICDATGCIYVTGTVTLDPAKDVGTTITVVGRLARTGAGQVYLTLVSATTQTGSVCPT